MKIANSITELIGNTPLLLLDGYGKRHGLSARLVAKLESFNPLSSAKDRVALAMVEEAEKRGALQKGGTIIEPTSGNTGVGLAFVAASRGYRMILTMPDTMSLERRRLATALGAQVVLTEGAKGMSGAIEKAEQLAREIPGAFLAGQFTNPENPKAHERTTAQEIWRDTDGAVDIFVAGVGTGGTITGVGHGLRAHNPAIQLVGAEPASSPFSPEGRLARTRFRESEQVLCRRSSMFPCSMKSSASPMTLRLKQPVSSQEMMVFLPEFLPVLPYGRLPALRSGRKTRENRLWFCFPTQANAIFPPEFMTIDAFAAQV